MKNKKKFVVMSAGVYNFLFAMILFELVMLFILSMLTIAY